MRSKRPPDDSRTDRSLVDDERAIEGLPIRLVIALVVGVAALAIMMNMLTGLDLGNEEVTVVIEGEGYVEEGGSGVDVTAVSEESGEELDDATIIAKSGTAEYTGDPQVDGSISGSDVELRPNQDTGTIQFEVIPPEGSTNYEDNGNNPQLIVVDGGGGGSDGDD